MSEESQICAKCHEHYCLNDAAMEPSTYCDDCAHDVAEEYDKLRAEVKRLVDALIGRKDSFELGLLALGRGNPEFNKSFCGCDPEVGVFICEYCAMHSAIQGALICADLANALKTLDKQ